MCHRVVTSDEYKKKSAMFHVSFQIMHGLLVYNILNAEK